VSPPAFSGIALLCLLDFASTVCVGAFGPLLPEIARAQGLPDWQLGVVAGAFGLARMAADLPVGMLATRRLGSTLALAPIALLAGVLLLATAGPLPVLILGRLLTGLAQTLVMVGSLTAVLQDQRGSSPSVRLNMLEFSGMLGVLGGLTLVAVLPEGWRWNTTLLAASTPVVLALLAAMRLRRVFPDRVEPARSAHPLERGRAEAGRGGLPAVPPVVKLMFVQGAIMALAWSAVSQFVVPLRGTREFGLDRSGISSLLALSQLMDLLVLLPVGWLADRIGRRPLLVAGALVLGLGRLRALRARHGGLDVAARDDPGAHRGRASGLARGRLPDGRGRRDVPRPADLRIPRRGAHVDLHRAGGSRLMRDRGEADADVAAAPRPLPREGEGAGPGAQPLKLTFLWAPSQ